MFLSVRQRRQCIHNIQHINTCPPIPLAGTPGSGVNLEASQTWRGGRAGDHLQGERFPCRSLLYFPVPCDVVHAVRFLRGAANR